MDSAAVKKTEEEAITRVSVVRHITLLNIVDAMRALIAFCDVFTRLRLAQVCDETKRRVVEAFFKESKLPLAKLGVALRSAIPWTECRIDELRSVLSTTLCKQFIATVAQRFVFVFAKCGDYWVAAMHCDDRHVAAIGWKPVEIKCTPRPIALRMTALPPVGVFLKWKTTVGEAIWSVATNGDTIAVGTLENQMALLSAESGEKITESLKGKIVTFLDDKRVVGVMKNEREKWILSEYIGTRLVNEVMIGSRHISSVKASANGKLLYVGRENWQVLEFATSSWRLKARIAVGGQPRGVCDYAANGMLVLDVFREEEENEYIDIELVETNTRCVTQTIRAQHSAFVAQTAFSPDSTRFVSVSFDNIVRLFDAVSGQLIGEPRVGHTNWVSSVCWMSDDWFITVSRDLSIIVWHCASQQLVARKKHAHECAITSVRRVSDDSFVTGSWDGGLKLWQFILGSAK